MPWIFTSHMYVCVVSNKELMDKEIEHNLGMVQGMALLYTPLYRLIPSMQYVPPLCLLTVSSLERSLELCFNMGPLLSIGDIFKAGVMTRCAHLCFMFLRGQQNNRDLSLYIRLRSPQCPATSSNGQGTSIWPSPPPPLPHVLPQSPLSHPVFCFLSILSAVNILHQPQTIMTFIFASSFTGVACAIYT